VVAATQGSTSTTSSSNADFNHAKCNLHQAIQYAGLAVEADPRDVKYWHLLGLLLAAQERWEEAREVLEKGADLGVSEDDADVEGQVGGEVVGGIPSVERMEHKEENDTVNGDSSNTTPTIKIGGVENKDVSPITSTNPPQPIYILSHSHSHSHSQSSSTTTAAATTPSLPPASTLLLTPPPSKYPPSQYDLYESHLQIRMTQGTVMEVVEGAEGAEAFWLEVFGWVAARKSALAAGGGGVQRRSIDGITQRSSDLISSSHHHSTMTTIDGSPHHLHPNSNPNPNVHHLHYDQHQHQHQYQQHSYLGAPTDNTQVHQTQTSVNGSSDLETNVSITDTIPITISPATPIITGEEVVSSASEKGKWRDRGKDQGKDQGKEKRTLNNAFRPKRSISIDIERDNNRVDGQRSKKNVGQMLKGSVMKSRAGITAATKKLGHGVVRHGGLRRSTSTPGSFGSSILFLRKIQHFILASVLDFHVVFQQQQTSYQASSIHSRRRLSFMSASRERPLAESPPPLFPAPTPPATTQHQPSSTPTPTLIGHQDIKNERSIKDDRLLSDLWLMSAATFRRLRKIDQAKGAIQEAEVKDENNPAVWVQVFFFPAIFSCVVLNKKSEQFGLYYIAIGLYQHAVDTFQKALFICPDDVAATVHLSRLYLDPDLNARLHAYSSTSHSTTTTTTSSSEGKSTTDSSNSSTTLLLNSDVDLAAGMLSYLTRGKGWNVPEAWYYLAKAYGLQGRKEKEKEILRLALELSERRGVRDVGSALGWCYL
jgi:tetratricopeptide (TPR) repeat protein